MNHWERQRKRTDAILKILALRESGLMYREISDALGVSIEIVSRICNPRKRYPGRVSRRSNGARLGLRHPELDGVILDNASAYYALSSADLYDRVIDDYGSIEGRTSTVTCASCASVAS